MSGDYQLQILDTIDSVFDIFRIFDIFNQVQEPQIENISLDTTIELNNKTKYDHNLIINRLLCCFLC